MKRLDLSAAELAAVLAGLRLLEFYTAGRGVRTKEIHAILTDCGTIDPLPPEKIDGLCAKLNH